MRELPIEAAICTYLFNHITVLLSMSLWLDYQVDAVNDAREGTIKT